jgi:molybdopterin-guanine dinucleotide biosynthesis protein A
MGQNKAWLPFPLASPHSGHRWIHQMILTLKTVPCQEVWISGAHPHYEGLADRVLPDLYPDLGPLGGLFSLLPVSGFSHLAIVPVDMPLLLPDLIRDLIGDLLQEAQPHDAAVFENHPLPLICRPSPRLTQAVMELCAPSVPDHERSLRALTDRLRTRTLPVPTSVERYLQNFNRPEDLERLSPDFFWKPVEHPGEDAA